MPFLIITTPRLALDIVMMGPTHSSRHSNHSLPWGRAVIGTEPQPGTKVLPFLFAESLHSMRGGGVEFAAGGAEIQHHQGESE